MARHLVIMGSGETTPGMIAVHRQVFAGLDPQAPRLLLDSPFAFQTNAAELAERISGYFAESLGETVDRVSLPAGADALAVARAVDRIESAQWVFAGPGSPSYARRAWVGTGVPEALAAVVAPGRSTAVLAFASAAAVTLGDWSLPVYEIYKVGLDPYWEPGLGLMRRILDLRCAVVPHYDNREGGTHDTSRCWVGIDRLVRIEGQLDGGFILGIDEHTALVVDLDAQACSVHGRGRVVVRVGGAETALPAGTSFPVDRIRQIVAAPGSASSPERGARPIPGDAATSVAAAAAPVPPPPGAGRTAATPADPGSSGAAAATVPQLASAVLAALPGDALQARHAVVTLADLAEGTQHLAAHAVATPFVAALVEERLLARTARDWAASDRIRDLLTQLGVQVRDTREGSEWTWLA